jgi:hypothetical protein
MRKLALLVAVACVALGALASGSVAVTPSGTVVMSGLHNPRGLAFDHHGNLYVAEAGQGGAAPCAVFADGMTKCYGPSGRVSRLRHGVQEVVASGLPSNAPAGGGAATGPHDLAFKGGKAYLTDGLGANPLDPTIAPFRARGQGWLFKMKPDPHHPNHWQRKTDISAFEAANNPIGPPDSNPYGILSEHGRPVVTDAGGNDLLTVHGNHASLLAVFPSRPARSTDSVPTSVTRGPDGAYYVGELTGFPFDPEVARVYRVVPGQAPQPYGPTFSYIIDLTWGPDGHLYVLQFATPPFPIGPAVLYRLDGTTKVPVVTGLSMPGSVAFGPGGAIYISNKSTNPVAGEVLRFP